MELKPSDRRRPISVHPKAGDQGERISIHQPSTPTPASTWTDAEAIATWVPGGKAPQALNGIPFTPWDDHPTDHDDWNFEAGVNFDLHEPTVLRKPGKAEAAGCLIQEPDGRVWVVSPTNQFGGYTHTFPKGRRELGINLPGTAIKEAYEESGLRVRITGVLGDFERTTTITRFYLAQRVGGTPIDPTWETQAVHLVPKRKLRHFVTATADEKVIQALLRSC